jgi:hypothetical protein
LAQARWFIGRADEKELFESALANLMAESRRETHEALWHGFGGRHPTGRKKRLLPKSAIYQ